MILWHEPHRRSLAARPEAVDERLFDKHIKTLSRHNLSPPPLNLDRILRIPRALPELSAPKFAHGNREDKVCPKVVAVFEAAHITE